MDFCHLDLHSRSSQIAKTLQSTPSRNKAFVAYGRTRFRFSIWVYFWRGVAGADQCECQKCLNLKETKISATGKPATKSDRSSKLFPAAYFLGGSTQAPLLTRGLLQRSAGVTRESHARVAVRRIVLCSRYSGQW